MNYHTLLSDISSAIVIMTAMGAAISKVYPILHKWGLKRTVNLISGIGLITTGLSMVALSGIAQGQMFTYTGFILPLATLTIHGLTNDQAMIFSNFSNFFYSTIGIGIGGVTIGIVRFARFLRLGNSDKPPTIYQ